MTSAVMISMVFVHRLIFREIFTLNTLIMMIKNDIISEKATGVIGEWKKQN